MFCLAGFLAIGIGWNGMAKVACPDCQLPYLLSGGATGLGLILFGVALLLMAHIRSTQLVLERNFDRMLDALARVGATGGEAVTATGLVVAGRSTYHRLDCRVIKGKRGLTYVTLEVAKQSGLTSCRVCAPDVSRDESALTSENSEPPTKAEPSVTKSIPREPVTVVQKRGPSDESATPPEITGEPMTKVEPPKQPGF